MSVIIKLIFSHFEQTPAALTALDPFHHILYGFRDLFAEEGLYLRESIFFGVPIEPALLSILEYLGLITISGFVAIMGPEIPLITGLHVFGETATTGKKRRRTRSILTRSSEIAFLYENRPNGLRRVDLLVRDCGTGCLASRVEVRNSQP